jgi:methylmalonyl-CoA mutase
VQALERAGGVAAALDSGMVGEILDATWAARAAAIARRKDPITGVSEFPDIAEAPVVRPPAPEPPHGIVPRRRYAEGFEHLRDRAETTPVRPTVFLANLGPVAVHTARSMFAKNFFESGGIVALGNDGFDSPVAVANAFADSGATIACICSTDAVYDERAESTALALREAGARRVYLAGRHEAPGVDEHVYAGCDAIEVLERALSTVLGEVVR